MGNQISCYSVSAYCPRVSGRNLSPSLWTWFTVYNLSLSSKPVVLNLLVPWVGWVAWDHLQAWWGQYGRIRPHTTSLSPMLPDRVPAQPAPVHQSGMLSSPLVSHKSGNLVGQCSNCCHCSPTTNFSAMGTSMGQMLWLLVLDLACRPRVEHPCFKPSGSSHWWNKDYRLQPN